ncbi:MAG: thiamine pyrophosphate-binding protein [Chloroflexi bacterium]|nr:thiamine pyrophosphate-binding protein [Chloroflexota bacterium]
MQTRQFTGNPSQVMVEQLAASGVKYVFYNSGSREAMFFDALHGHPDVHGILALHEGAVAAMAGGYAQVKGDPAVMVVHLGAGLAQSLGQLFNAWNGGLPVVVISFAGDTGSFADSVTLNIDHSFGPTYLSAPFTKASWAVVEPEGLPEAIERAIKVATSAPTGPVHLAVYDRLLGTQPVTANIIEADIPNLRAGYADDADLQQIAAALDTAERPLLYVGDGIAKSGAQGAVTALAEHYGAAVACASPDLLGVSIAHPLHCGPFGPAAAAVNPDCILAIGVRHAGAGITADYAPFRKADRVFALGSDIANLQNLPGLDNGIVADEGRAVGRLLELAQKRTKKQSGKANGPDPYDKRRKSALDNAADLRAARRSVLQPGGDRVVKGRVRPLVLLDALETELEKVGGGIITSEQFAIALECVAASDGGGIITHLRRPGESEGWGMGAAAGAKLAAPDTPVIGLVGDGSVYYSDSVFWTVVAHGIPVLYVIPNNAAYGIVATLFAAAGGQMRETGQYAGVGLEGIDPLGLARAYGLEGERVEDEANVAEAIARGLAIVEKEKRPFVLDVRLPSGLPEGAQAAEPFRLSDA